MSTILSSSQNPFRTELMKSLCEAKLEIYISKLMQSYEEKNWKELSEISLSFENDCYCIGEVEIAGKIIILRLQLLTENVDFHVVEIFLNKILVLSVKLQQFLLKKLKSLGFVQEDKIKYIQMSSLASSVQCPGFISFCTIQ